LQFAASAQVIEAPANNSLQSSSMLSGVMTDPLDVASRHLGLRWHTLLRAQTLIGRRALFALSQSFMTVISIS
jgi:hypothetical protein